MLKIIQIKINYTKKFILKSLFLMLLANFIFVVAHLKIHPAVHLNTSKVIVVKKKSLLKVF